MGQKSHPDDEFRPPAPLDGPAPDQIERAKEIEHNPELEVSDDEVAWATEILRDAGEL